MHPPVPGEGLEGTSPLLWLGTGSQLALHPGAELPKGTETLKKSCCEAAGGVKNRGRQALSLSSSSERGCVFSFDFGERRQHFSLDSKRAAGILFTLFFLFSSSFLFWDFALHGSVKLDGHPSTPLFLSKSSGECAGAVSRAKGALCAAGWRNKLRPVAEGLMERTGEKAGS